MVLFKISQPVCKKHGVGLCVSCYGFRLHNAVLDVRFLWLPLVLTPFLLSFSLLSSTFLALHGITMRTRELENKRRHASLCVLGVVGNIWEVIGRPVEFTGVKI